MTTGLPKLLTEREAAEMLGVSIDTVRRERKRRRIGHAVIGGRVRYTQDHLAKYIETWSVSACPADEPTTLARSATTGSPSAPTAPSGVEHGSTRRPDRLAVHHSAQAIFGRPSLPSRHG